MANRNKAKGTDWESEIVGYAKACGLSAWRTGSADMGSSDVHFGNGWTAEAKNEARIDLPGYLAQLRKAVIRSGREAARAAVWVKNRRHAMPLGYVVMYAADYMDLVLYVEALEKGTVEAFYRRSPRVLRGGRRSGSWRRLDSDEVLFPR